MSHPGKAVFLSYASQDADAANRICGALGAADIEVWFDQSELRGGDAWDASIRAKIRDCALFVPIVSANTDARGEGYFRLEWKLAVDRSHLMAEDEPFLVPVVIDATSEASARVPAAFRERQWTRLPEGLGAAGFVGRVKRLLDAPDAPADAADPATTARAAPRARPPSSSRKALAAGLGLAALAAVAFIAYQPFRGDAPASRPATTASTAAAPAAQSVAVLPFANLSDDKANEYFSDGISEELLTVLQRVSGLQVVARSSSFAFKGGSVTAQEIGQKLGVAHLVEGSVRKAGKSVRISARLVRAATGEQLWSDAYTRDLDDVFAVQAALAQTIVEQLRAHLGGALSASAKAEVESQIQAATKGGTRNTEAHQLYLQGLYFLHQFSVPTGRKAQGFLERAVEIDPGFALAWAALSRAGTQIGGYGDTKREFDAGWALARRAAERALVLEPGLSAAHLARMNLQLWHDYDWKGARDSLRRAQRLAPGDADVVYSAAMLSYALGLKDAAVKQGREAVARDPLNAETRSLLGIALDAAGRPDEAEAHFRRIIEINPDAPWGHAGIGLTFLSRGRFEEAVRETRLEATEWSRLTVLACALWGDGKRPESDATLDRLTRNFADVAAQQIAQVHAYRGENDRAFEWLERAFRQRDAGMAWLKPDPIFARLHGDPRWAAFLRKLGLADEQLE